MIIGLTGGIATGKSTVASIMTQYGALLIDADQIAREVVMPGEPLLEKVVETFGQAVLKEDGSLDRKALGEIVFSDANKRKQLEQLLHPTIRQRMIERMNEYERSHPERLVVVDVPLLFENGLENYFEQVVLVYVPRSIQLQRLMERDHISEEDALRRIHAQMDIEAKKERADYIIDNSRDLKYTTEQTLKYLKNRGLKIE